MSELVVVDRAAVLEVLESTTFVPPAAPWPAEGAVMRLRAAMARFSGPDVHSARRSAVSDVIVGIDPGRARTTAAELTRRRLGGHEIEAVGHLGRSVPTETLLGLLQLPHDGTSTVDDVDRIVAVIGRGAAPSDEADAATERLLSLAAVRDRDPVAVVSVLYQAFDATAALLATELHARCVAATPVPAVPRTRRVASGRATITGAAITPGTTVTLEIGAADLPFGAGPHRCPAEQLARRIVDGIIGAIVDSGHRVDPESIVTDADGRATRLVMRRDDRVQPPS